MDNKRSAPNDFGGTVPKCSRVVLNEPLEPVPLSALYHMQLPLLDEHQHFTAPSINLDTAPIYPAISQESDDGLSLVNQPSLHWTGNDISSAVTCRLCGQAMPEKIVRAFQQLDDFDWLDLPDGNKHLHATTLLRNHTCGSAKHPNHGAIWNFNRRNRWFKRCLPGMDLSKLMTAYLMYEGSVYDSGLAPACKYSFFKDFMGDGWEQGDIGTTKLIAYLCFRFGIVERHIIVGLTTNMVKKVETTQRKSFKEAIKKDGFWKKVQAELACHKNNMQEAIGQQWWDISNASLPIVFSSIQDVFLGQYYKKSIVYLPTSKRVAETKNPTDCDTPQKLLGIANPLEPSPDHSC